MIKLITVGTIKEEYFRNAISEYSKRLSKYTNLEIIELKEETVGETLKILDIEGKRILQKIKEKDFVITLEIEGKELESISLAKELENIMSRNSNIDFIIGGSYGLSDNVKKRANYKLSFSKLTFPHQLFRVIVLEQIYRSFKIINNESYHK